MKDETAFSQGVVEFIELSASMSPFLNHMLRTSSGCAWDEFLRSQSQRSFYRHNLVFNYPREQYARLDRGETPLAVNVSWLTLSNDAYINPTVETVAGETLRVAASTRAVDPINPKNTIFRFILDVGQFIGSWKTALLIGGETATATPGTGQIIAAVNDVRDDSNVPLNRDGTTIHLVNWKLKHLDSSEV